jgi:septal ring factor EnvC (AmiA/AmiB activator)
MSTQFPWTLALAFGAGLVPGVAFGLYVLAATKRTAQVSAALAQVQRDLARVRIENAELEATLARLKEQHERLEAFLPQVRRDDHQIRRVLTQDRLRRTLGDLKRVREEWLNGRRLDQVTNESPCSSRLGTGPSPPTSRRD